MGYQNELYHHGIFGQKWGKRNGPPYPLKVSAHSAAEKKAGWRKSLDREKSSTYNLNQKNDRTTKASTSNQRLRLTDKQKKAIVFGVGVALAVGATVYLSNAGAFSESIGAGQNASEKVLQTFSGVSVKDLEFNPKDFLSDQTISHDAEIPQFPKIDGFPDNLTKEYLLQDLSNVNPDGGRSNCVACSITEYFRSRGYDVIAKGRDNGLFGNTFSIDEIDCLLPGFENRFKNRIPITKNVQQSSNAIRARIAAHGEGSFGVFAVNYSDDYKNMMKLFYPDFNDEGHMISWKVLNGEIIFMDGQNNASGNGILESLVKNADLNRVFEARIDDLDIDPSFIPVFMKPAK